MREAGDAGPHAQEGPGGRRKPARRALSRAGRSLTRAEKRRAEKRRRADDLASPGQEVGPLRRTAAKILARCAEIAARWATRLLGQVSTTGGGRISEAELRLLIGANTGTRNVRELMVPRTEVVFLDAALTVARAVRAARVARHSRFPVIDGDQDDVIGFVHLRDLTLRPELDPISSVRELTRDVKRLPASKRVLAALSEMRREGHHLAVVVDEYGGTAGIVTLEDLIEELVGEIHDEYDAAPEPVSPAGAGPSEVDGLLNLPDFAERTGVLLPNGPYETVGGFLMARLGKMPEIGDEVPLEGWRLVVAALDGRRISRVSLVPLQRTQLPPT